MTSQIIPVEPFDYVVFGGTGDLAERKLLPALFRRFLDGQLIGDWRVIAAARGEMDDEAYRNFAREALATHVRGAAPDPAKADEFVSHLHYVAVDAKSDRGWDHLRSVLGDHERVRCFHCAGQPRERP